MNDSATILAIGDVHLGTVCSGLPDVLPDDWGIASNELSPEAALKLSVDFAIKKNLDAVLFAGDIVESTNARFEAHPPLEDAVKRLIEKGIQVVAVAGNHDFEALPRLSKLINGFNLLGAGGRWEVQTITKNQEPIANVVGWSFGERHVRQSPVAQLLKNPVLASASPIPTIGLLHADLDASDGPYAPIRREQLDNTGYDTWLLGHIHKPSLDGPGPPTGRRPYGYIGSLVGLDPSETGPHGPWLVRLLNNGNLCLAPLRWDHLSISIERLEDVEDVPDKLLSEATNFVHQLRKAQTENLPRVLGLRAKLTGASSQYEEIRKWIAGGEWKNLTRNVDGTAVFFNKIFDAIKLPLDLAEIAKGDDPAALMAQRLLTLGRNDKKSQAMLHEVRTKLSPIADQDTWSPVKDHRNAPDPLSDNALRDLLMRSGRAALYAMLDHNAKRGSS